MEYEWYLEPKTKEWIEWVEKSSLDDLGKYYCDYYDNDYIDCINDEEYKDWKRKVNIAEEWKYEYLVG